MGGGGGRRHAINKSGGGTENLEITVGVNKGAAITGDCWERLKR